ncbi:hypothetical protein ACFLTP_00885 [Chloroflexota bacterium]
MEQQVSKITALILKAIALAMSVSVVILNIIGDTAVETSITLLGFGLLAMVLGSFIDVKEPD